MGYLYGSTALTVGDPYKLRATMRAVWFVFGQDWRTATFPNVHCRENWMRKNRNKTEGAFSCSASYVTLLHYITPGFTVCSPMSFVFICGWVGCWCTSWMRKPPITSLQLFLSVSLQTLILAHSLLLYARLTIEPSWFNNPGYKLHSCNVMVSCGKSDSFSYTFKDVRCSMQAWKS